MSKEYFSKNQKFKVIVPEDKIEDNIIYQDDKEIMKLERKYNNFVFFTKNNQDWLICTKDYYQQLFINLEDVKMYEFNSDGFCWVRMFPSPNSNILLVLGCVWACTYEYIFYDISDIPKGVRLLPFLNEEDKNFCLDELGLCIEGNICSQFGTNYPDDDFKEGEIEEEDGTINKPSVEFNWDEDNLEIICNRMFSQKYNKYIDDMTGEEFPTKTKGYRWNGKLNLDNYMEWVNEIKRFEVECWNSSEKRVACTINLIPNFEKGVIITKVEKSRDFQEMIDRLEKKNEEHMAWLKDQINNNLLINTIKEKLPDYSLRIGEYGSHHLSLHIANDKKRVDFRIPTNKSNKHPENKPITTTIYDEEVDENGKKKYVSKDIKYENNENSINEILEYIKQQLQ